MLFLHGFTGDPSTGNALRKELKIVPWRAPLLSGHGPSPSVTTYWHDELERIRSDREHSRICVGYSMGARLALTAAVRTPGLFDAIILIGVNPGLESDEARATRRAQDEKRARMLEANGLESFIEHWSALPLFEEHRLTKTRRAQRLRVRRRHTAKGLAHALRVFSLGAMEPLWSDLSTITIPIRFIYGERDEKFAKLAIRASRQTPNGTAHAIANAAHDALLFDPAGVAAIIRKTMKGVS